MLYLCVRVRGKRKEGAGSKGWGSWALETDAAAAPRRGNGNSNGGKRCGDAKPKNRARNVKLERKRTGKQHHSSITAAERWKEGGTKAAEKQRKSSIEK
eukprot:6113298-Pleurochrysis_carterae.AAC.1